MENKLGMSEEQMEIVEKIVIMINLLQIIQILKLRLVHLQNHQYINLEVQKAF